MVQISLLTRSVGQGWLLRPEFYAGSTIPIWTLISFTVTVLLQATIEYYQPHVTSKFVVGLNSSLPVEANACVGWNGFIAGGKAFLDVRSSKVSNYSLACAFQGPGFTATGHATEKFGKIVGTYWQKIDSLSAIAAEVVHEPSNNDVGLTMGYQHIEADGACFHYCACMVLLHCLSIPQHHAVFDSSDRLVLDTSTEILWVNSTLSVYGAMASLQICCSHSYVPHPCAGGLCHALQALHSDDSIP